ncbi:MAG: blaR1 2 [Planctomycetota bacterium]|nr:blaR1 2 [Planctomycetota bacterium]
MFAWFAETTIVAAFLAAIAGFASRSGKLGPAGRHALWLVVLLKMISPPILHWPFANSQSVPRISSHSQDQMAAPPGRSFSPPDRASASPSNPDFVSIDDPSNGNVGYGSDLEIQFPVPPSSAEEQEPSATRPFDAEENSNGLVVPERRAQPSAIGAVSLTTRIRAYSTYAREILIDLQPLAFQAWLLGSALFIAIHGWRIARFADVLRNAEPVPEWLGDAITQAAGHVGLRPPPARVVDAGGSPFLWCAGRATFVVPSGLLGRLEPACWDGILAHEMAHLKRFDAWTSRVALVAGVLWWWNPLYWLVRSRLEHEAELACDAMAVGSHPEARRRFAESLVAVCEAISAKPAPPALGMGSEGRFLERRLLMILNGHDSGRLPVRGTLAVALLAALSLPSWTLAQDAPKAPEPPKPPSTPVDPKPFPDVAPGTPGTPVPAVPAVPTPPVLPPTPAPPQTGVDVRTPGEPRLTPARNPGEENRPAEPLVDRLKMLEALRKEQQRQVAETQAQIDRVISQIRTNEHHSRAMELFLQDQIEARRIARNPAGRDVDPRSTRDTPPGADEPRRTRTAPADPVRPEPPAAARIRSRSPESNEIEMLNRRMDTMEKKLDMLLKKLEIKPGSPVGAPLAPPPLDPPPVDVRPGSALPGSAFNHAIGGSF